MLSLTLAQSNSGVEDLRKWPSACSYSEVWNLDTALQGMYSWEEGR